MPMRYNIDRLRLLAEQVLTEKGMSAKDASVLADSMLSADACGVSTHGIRMLPSYVQKMERGEFSFGSPAIVKQMPSFTVMDARNVVGAVSAVCATKIAVEMAKTSGIHVVFSRNSNTFGPGFYYAEMMANAGMIGLACSNSPAAMPAYNGLEAMLGTNPLAFASPTKSFGNVVIDMATSAVAKSRFGTAKENGEKLQPGWALDKNGNPTTDPDEGIQGFVLPMAGFKGYGLAMMIDLVSGLLSGAGYLNKVGKFYSKDGECMNVGHVFAAIHPDLIYDGDYLTEADNYVKRITASKTVSEKSIILPGEDRKRKREEAMASGIELTESVVGKLEQLFGETLI